VEAPGLGLSSMLKDDIINLVSLVHQSIVGFWLLATSDEAFAVILTMLEN
jgi:hypothetical protein